MRRSGAKHLACALAAIDRLTFKVTEYEHTSVAQPAFDEQIEEVEVRVGRDVLNFIDDKEVSDLLRTLLSKALKRQFGQHSLPEVAIGVCRRAAHACESEHLLVQGAHAKPHDIREFLAEAVPKQAVGEHTKPPRSSLSDLPLSRLGGKVLPVPAGP